MQNQAVGYGINYIKQNPEKAMNFAANNAAAIGNFAYQNQGLVKNVATTAYNQEMGSKNNS